MGNTEGTMMSGTEENVSTKQEQIARNARNLPEVSFTALSYHIDVGWLYEAYKAVRKDGATGVDGVTAEEYEEDLGENLKGLEDRMKSGLYKAPPVRRVYIPKGKGEKRPIGIPTFEDKVSQKAVAMVLEPLYEQDFYEFSYGFRPGRSQHMALDRIWKEIMSMKGAYILDLDISKYFDTIDHGSLREVLKKRVRDGVIIRMMGKWLKAGVMEGGRRMFPQAGSPQGGVISPLLSNVYLHEVLDDWFEQEVKPRMRGKASMVRFADDAVMMFEYEEDLKRVMEVLPKRLEKYGLKMNEEKTSAKRFLPPRKGGGKPDTFNFLGFTHYWGKSRKGNWVVRRKTESKRLSRSLHSIAQWCRKNRHLPVEVQQVKLNEKLRGHYNYYGITPNSKSLQLFSENVKRIWFKWLNRRSRTRHLDWWKFNCLLRRYPLEIPKIYHSYI
jgi:group II intron reverse transcriptase/maturase